MTRQQMKLARERADFQLKDIYSMIESRKQKKQEDLVFRVSIVSFEEEREEVLKMISEDLHAKGFLATMFYSNGTATYNIIF